MERINFALNAKDDAAWNKLITVRSLADFASSRAIQEVVKQAISKIWVLRRLEVDDERRDVWGVYVAVWLVRICLDDLEDFSFLITVFCSNDMSTFARKTDRLRVRSF